MKNIAIFAALALLAALILAAPAAGQTCTPVRGVSWTQVTLITQPFPFASLVPTPTAADTQGIPLPDPANSEIVRREHVYISESLADQLGIEPYDQFSGVSLNWDWRRPNPQIRVWVESIDGQSGHDSDDTFLNLNKARSSSAVFTIVGVLPGNTSRIWIYRQSTVGNKDRDNGEYKLFAIDTVTGEGKVKTFADANNDGRLDNVFVRVIRTPVSSSTVTEDGVATVDTHYCEPDQHGGRFVETAVKTADNRVALLIPHGENIETQTSNQVAPFVNRLEGSEFDGDDLELLVNVWDARGAWSDDQTFKRWHATSTNLHESSFPALGEMMDRDTSFANGRPFQYAVSFHGFTSTARRVIIGGQAPREERCMVARRIRTEIQAADGTVTVTYEVPSGGGGLDGDSPHNIVNRLAGPGGIQIEQSSALRGYSSNLLVAPVARGVAQAVGELIAGVEPAENVCEGF